MNCTVRKAFTYAFVSKAVQEANKEIEPSYDSHLYIPSAITWSCVCHVDCFGLELMLAKLLKLELHIL